VSRSPSSIKARLGLVYLFWLPPVRSGSCFEFSFMRPSFSFLQQVIYCQIFLLSDFPLASSPVQSSCHRSRVSLVFVALFICLRGSARGYVLLLYSHHDLSHTSVRLFVISVVAFSLSPSDLPRCSAACFPG
jgi:hypothetical protein